MFADVFMRADKCDCANGVVLVRVDTYLFVCLGMCLGEWVIVCSCVFTNVFGGTRMCL